MFVNKQFHIVCRELPPPFPIELCVGGLVLILYIYIYDYVNLHRTALRLTAVPHGQLIFSTPHGMS